MRRLLSEALLVTLIGTAAGVVANFVSPRGLSLTRDYFPANGRTARSVDVATGTDAIQREPPSATSEPTARSTAVTKGIPTVTTAQALELFREPQYEQELIVFVDARDDRHYDAGHIPGAYQLDHYYPQNHLPTVLPACLNALRVVVYCTGGECEDSHFAAQLLQDAGIPADRLVVYSGGMKEWDAKQLPIETGARKSGILRERKP